MVGHPHLNQVAEALTDADGKVDLSLSAALKALDVHARASATRTATAGS
ncbi:MAG: hypothetical protein E6640_01765 [Actinomyces urogenitalis]|nr:hypothetical protein [Actinomyces urogenitalis]MDU6150938.1 hypothetical protein [Actinomyces urogenitalis]